MVKELFSRRELKYLIPFGVYLDIVERMRPYTVEDPFADESGHYKIVSLYFESPDHKIYYETLNNTPFRQKLRLRMYNRFTASDDAFFEIKQKYKNVVCKRRSVMKLSEAYRFMSFTDPHGETGISADLNWTADHFGASNIQVLKEISSFRKLYRLSPKVIVSYERQAFIGKDDSDLRITSDRHLTCRSDSLKLEPGTAGSYFVDPALVVMEIKVSFSVPLWLSRILSEYRCPNQSVSKYCTSVDLVSPVNPQKLIAVF